MFIFHSSPTNGTECCEIDMKFSEEMGGIPIMSKEGSKVISMAL